MRLVKTPGSRAIPLLGFASTPVAACVGVHRMGWGASCSAGLIQDGPWDCAVCVSVLRWARFQAFGTFWGPNGPSEGGMV